MLTRNPAMLSVVDRGVPGLAATVKLTVPLPAIDQAQNSPTKGKEQKVEDVWMQACENSCPGALKWMPTASIIQ